MEDRYNVECCDFIHAHEEIVEKVRQELPDEDTLYDLSELFRIFGDSTCSICSSMVMFLWMMPMPPSRAMAMAILLSVTVSIAEDSRGMFRWILRVSWVPRLICLGTTSLAAGIRRTSSKVSPSFRNFVYRVNRTAPSNSPQGENGVTSTANGSLSSERAGGEAVPVFVSYNLRKDYDVTPIHVDVNIVSADVLDIEAFKAWRPEYANAEFVLEDGKYICGWAVEKMSKSMFNVVNPDMIVEKYGADTLRLYEMFLGPVEASKPWDTNGIDGCFRFLKKFWALFYENRTDEFLPADAEPTADNLKSLHKLIKKVTEDIEHFSYNTSISAFMIAVGELAQQKCRSKQVLEQLVVLIAPFAPHIAEELWHALGNTTTVCDAQWPVFNPQYLVESEVQLTVSFNGKARFQKKFAADATNDEIQAAVLADEQSKKYLDGKTVVKVIVVPKKIVNVVIK